MDQTVLQILLQVKDEASDSMRKFGSSLKDAEGASKGFALGLLGVGVAAVGFGYSVVKAAAEAQSQIASMDATLRSMGKGGEEAHDSIIKMSQAAVQLGFDDEDAAVSLARLYQRTGDLTEAQKLNATAMDLARAKHIELSMASSLVGMVMSGNSRVLKQFGIDIKDSATPLEALGILQQKVGGQAQAFAGGFQGQMAVLSVTFENFKESLGDQVLPALTKLATAATDFIVNVLPKWIDKAKQLIEFLKGHPAVMYAIAGAIIGALVPAVYAAVTAFIAAAVALAPFIIGGAIIGGIVAGVLWVVDHWSMLKEKAVEIFTAVKDFFKKVWDDIKNVFKEAIDWLMGLIQPFLDAINKVIGGAKSVGSLVGKSINAVGQGLTNVGHALGFADGGIITKPTFAMMGEAGAEAVIPLDRLKSLTGGGSVTNNQNILNLNINAKVDSKIDIRKMAEDISSVIMGQLKASQRI
ncbi:MAG: hypothetical protein NTX85_03300 [Candidatus Nomurabacteria bacterium]|nr:hypothetical protein [Candidatus Nomurabacteria bacterium]MCX6788443.1 hypothetical protein [Candidatus Jorgensenbacteria bacterium]